MSPLSTIQKVADTPIEALTETHSSPTVCVLNCSLPIEQLSGLYIVLALLDADFCLSADGMLKTAVLSQNILHAQTPQSTLEWFNCLLPLQ